MNLKNTLAFAALLFLSACSGGAAEGEECTTDADCADGLECHLHEHDGETSDHGECEAHDHDEHTDHTDDTDHDGE